MALSGKYHNIRPIQISQRGKRKEFAPQGENSGGKHLSNTQLQSGLLGGAVRVRGSSQTSAAGLVVGQLYNTFLNNLEFLSQSDFMINNSELVWPKN